MSNANNLLVDSKNREIVESNRPLRLLVASGGEATLQKERDYHTNCSANNATTQLKLPQQQQPVAIVSYFWCGNRGGGAASEIVISCVDDDGNAVANALYYANAHYTTITIEDNAGNANGLFTIQSSGGATGGYWVSITSHDPTNTTITPA